MSKNIAANLMLRFAGQSLSHLRERASMLADSVEPTASGKCLEFFDGSRLIILDGYGIADATTVSLGAK